MGPLSFLICKGGLWVLTSHGFMRKKGNCRCAFPIRVDCSPEGTALPSNQHAGSWTSRYLEAHGLSGESSGRSTRATMSLPTGPGETSHLPKHPNFHLQKPPRGFSPSLPHRDLVRSSLSSTRASEPAQAYGQPCWLPAAARRQSRPEQPACEGKTPVRS